MSTIFMHRIYPRSGYFIQSKMDQSIFSRLTALSNFRKNVESSVIFSRHQIFSIYTTNSLVENKNDLELDFFLHGFLLFRHCT